jgi:flagellar biosynthesis GTPase FlhF
MPPIPELRGNYQASVYARHAEVPQATLPPPVSAPPIDSPTFNRQDYGGWRVGELLEAGGLLPRFVQRLIARAQSVHGHRPPENAAEEHHVVRQLLSQAWNRGDDLTPQRCRVFIGAPRVGKSTALCKWLVQSVLVEGRTARVWRLDSQLANTAESVSVFCDILRVPIDRALNPSPLREDVLFVDLPGVNTNDPSAIGSLKGLLATLPDKEVYLVLNAAYETPVLFAQARAFSSLSIQGLVFTHLDEEARWGKIWNFVFGTNYTVRFLCAGQNVPGDFFEATPARLASRILP